MDLKNGLPILLGFPRVVPGMGGIHKGPEKMLNKIAFDLMDHEEVPGVPVHEVTTCAIAKIEAFKEGVKVLSLPAFGIDYLRKDRIAAPDLSFDLLPQGEGIGDIPGRYGCQEARHHQTINPPWRIGKRDIQDDHPLPSRSKDVPEGFRPDRPRIDQPPFSGLGLSFQPVDD